jgi:cyclic-di-GMP-binding protein
MPSFDIVSKVAWHEVENALNQALKEIGQRFDFKDTDTSIERTAEGISIRSSSEDRAKAAVKVLEEKLVRRKVSLKHVDPQKPEPTGKGGTRILLKIKEGVDIDRARKIVGLVKDSKLKVQAQIQDNQVRVNGKNRDDLQSVIHLMRQQDLGIELQFVNYRD